MLVTKNSVHITILLALCTMVLAVFPSYSQTVCEETQGRVDRSYYTAVQTQMAYSVYVPPCYDDSQNTYPVIYLMHGSTEDDGHWLRLGMVDLLDESITSGQIPPVIAVFPFGNWMSNENAFDREGWGEVFVNEVMPRVEDAYRVDAQRESRVIGGISRGGFWAFHIALRYPDLFSALGGHSAFFDEYHASAEYNPLDLIETIDTDQNLRIWLDRGGADYAEPGLDLMHFRLEALDIPHAYVVSTNGQHNNQYWSQHLAAYLEFYTAEWQPQQAPTIFATNTPVPTPLPSVTDLSQGVTLFVPAVVFNSLESLITRADLQNILDGGADSRLVLSESTVAMLANNNIQIAPEIRTVPDETLYNTLFRDRSRYTVLPFDQLAVNYRVLSVDGEHPLDSDLSLYPLAFISDSPNFFLDRLTTMTLSGVTALTRGTLMALDTQGLEWATEAILPYVTQSDYFHTSNEVSFYENCPQFNNETLGGSTSFCSKPEHFELFNLLDVDVVELSGNHNNDYGYDIYRETLSWFGDNDMLTVGGGETLMDARQPVILQHQDNMIAMIACNWIGPYYALVNEDPALTGGVRPGAAFCDTEWLEATLPQLAFENDVVIVTVQYPEVDAFVPPDNQRFDFRQLADWGADVVIGTSSHFPQSVEFYAPVGGGRTAFIHYGLGNLFFDQTFFGGTRFFMDRLYIYDGELQTIDLYTGIIEEQGRPRPMTADERYNFLFLMFNEYALQ